MMRITSLTMRDFRCFRGSTTIDLNADVVAIYGRNGSGKTTVFDAIEFALLGEIGRFASEQQTLSYLPNALEKALPIVRINYNDGTPNHLEVSLQPDGSIELSAPWSTHRDFLYEWLVREEYQIPRREVSAVRDLFRASVLLSQWSIRQFVRADPADRASVLANIAGVPYLQRCLEKAQDVQKLAEKREAKFSGDLQLMVADLQKIANDVAATENRRKAVFTRLGDKLVVQDDLMRSMAAAKLTFELTSETQTPEEVASGATALCREAIADLDRRERMLAELEVVAHGHRERVAQRQHLSKERESLQANAAQLEKRETALSGGIAAAQAQLRATEKRLADLTRRLLALDEITQLRIDMGSQKELRKSAAKRQQDLQRLIGQAKTRLKGLLGTKAVASRLELTRAHDNAISVLDRLRKLQASLPAYRSDIENLRKCDSLQAEADQKLKTFREHKTRLERSQNALNRRLAELQTKRGKLNSTQQRKNSLVASLREYATGDRCPMCGTAHQTPQALANAIKKQLETATQNVRDLAKQIETERAELQRTEAEMQTVNESIHREEKSRQVMSQERAALASRTKAQERLAQQVNIKMEAHQIQQAISAWEGNLVEEAKNLEEIDSAVRLMMQERNQLEMAISQYEITLTQESHKLSAAQMTLTKIERRAADVGFKNSIKWSAQELAKNRAQLANDKESTQAEKLQKENELTNVTQEWNSIREARERVVRDLKQSTGKLAEATETIRRTERLCQQLRVGSSDPEEAAKVLREDLADLRRRVNFAANTAQQYQWSSAVAALSAEEQWLRKRHEEGIANIAALENQRRRLGEAGRVAGTWSDNLRDEVTRVVERRIQAHQPEILRLFKAMVPCPYLFDDIKMQGSKNGVDLGLKYRDQVRAPAEPRLFLSEAQANVLALAIFLSFACSQQWSRLQTILLDDPVQHLDDLDAVAFLDNLRAVALQRQKQVVVSTCDQNLYLLMIRKFRVIGKEGVRFRGISLLENGSNAPEVVYDIGGPGVSAAVA